MPLQKSLFVKLIAVGVTAIVLTVSSVAFLSPGRNAPLNATISAVNIGVYGDSSCTDNCTSINAGNMEPGSSKTFTVYVKNTGTVPMTLNMTTSGWNPASADGPITLTWDREGSSLAAGSSVVATLTLSVTSTINTAGISTFSLNVAIIGTE